MNREKEIYFMIVEMINDDVFSFEIGDNDVYYANVLSRFNTERFVSFKGKGDELYCYKVEEVRHVHTKKLENSEPIPTNIWQRHEVKSEV